MHADTQQCTGGNDLVIHACAITKCFPAPRPIFRQRARRPMKGGLGSSYPMLLVMVPSSLIRRALPHNAVFADHLTKIDVRSIARMLALQRLTARLHPDHPFMVPARVPTPDREPHKCPLVRPRCSRTFGAAMPASESAPHLRSIARPSALDRCSPGQRRRTFAPVVLRQES